MTRRHGLIKLLGDGLASIQLGFQRLVHLCLILVFEHQTGINQVFVFARLDRALHTEPFDDLKSGQLVHVDFLHVKTLLEFLAKLGFHAGLLLRLEVLWRVRLTRLLARDA